MKRYTFIYGLFAVLFTCISCQEQDMMHYEDDPAIYFANERLSVYYSVQNDSINHSFFIYGEDVKQDTVHILVRIMGNPTDYDRPFKLTQTNIGQPDAAIAGTHYIPFDDPALVDSFSIPAGEVSRFIPIVLLRDESLTTETARLELTLEANEHFRQGIDEWRNFLVTTSDTAVKPKIWDSYWKYYFGESWGPVKMRFIIQTTGLTDFDTRLTDYSYLDWLGDTAKQALLEYNAERPEEEWLQEADGTPVSFDN